jgi:hypothetical protein
MAAQPNAAKEKLIDDEEVLQAVILADSFNKRFRPLTARKPRVRNQVYLWTRVLMKARAVLVTHMQFPSPGLDV